MGEHRRRYSIPDGLYAVDDQDGRETYWWVENGRLRDWPTDARWRPLPPPRPAEVPREQRREWLAGWYESNYWPYKEAIVEVISLDPAAAADRFRRRWPDVDPPPPPARKRSRPPRRPATPTSRQAETLAVQVLTQRGMSVRQIAVVMGWSRMYVWRLLNPEEGV